MIDPSPAAAGSAADPGREPARVLARQGFAHHTAGNFTAAIDAFDAVLRTEPDQHVVRLHKAGALERLGRRREALVSYLRALQGAQAQGYWRTAETTPPAMRERVVHATRFVNQGRRELFMQVLEPLRHAHGRDALKRVEQCLAVYLGDARAEHPDPRQQPTFLYFPGLPPSAYLDRALFPWLPQLESQTAAILEELQQVLPSEEGRVAVFHAGELERTYLRGEAEKPRWDGYYFYRHGVRHEGNCGRCPRTAAALDAASLARVRDHAPEVLFSVFNPGTHLLPHRGVTNTRVVAHLPLIVPPDCALQVGGEVHAWQVGRGVVFDDTYEHEAWNRSGETRVVLILDIWNPHLTDSERAAVAELVAAIGDFRVECEAAAP